MEQSGSSVLCRIFVKNLLPRSLTTGQTWVSLFKVGRRNAKFELAAELVRVLVHIFRGREDDFISCFDNCNGGLWIELALQM